MTKANLHLQFRSFRTLASSKARARHSSVGADELEVRLNALTLLTLSADRS